MPDECEEEVIWKNISICKTTASTRKPVGGPAAQSLLTRMGAAQLSASSNESRKARAGSDIAGIRNSESLREMLSGRDLTLSI